MPVVVLMVQVNACGIPYLVLSVYCKWNWHLLQVERLESDFPPPPTPSPCLGYFPASFPYQGGTFPPPPGSFSAPAGRESSHPTMGVDPTVGSAASATALPVSQPTPVGANGGWGVAVPPQLTEVPGHEGAMCSTSTPSFEHGQETSSSSTFHPMLAVQLQEFMDEDSSELSQL